MLESTSELPQDDLLPELSLTENGSGPNGTDSIEFTGSGPGPVAELTEPQRRLAESHLHIASYAIRQFIVRGLRGVEYEDLLQEARFGLLQASSRYDPKLNDNFPRYALTRIIGSIKDYLKNTGVLSRFEQKLLKDWLQAADELGHKLERTPTRQEISEHLGMDDETSTKIHSYFLRHLPLRLDETVSLDAEGRPLTVLDELAYPGDDIEQWQDRDYVREMLEQTEAPYALNAQEVLVIKLYFFNDLTLAAIGEILGVSESRVSQIRTNALKKLYFLAESSRV